MKQLNINSAELSNALKKVSGYISKNPIMPILETVLIEGKNGSIFLTATNLESTITLKVCASDLEFKIAPEASVLIQLLRNTSNKALTLIVKDDALVVNTGKGKYVIPCENPEEYPRQEDREYPIKVSIDTKELKTGLSKVVNSVSTDNLRPAMAGVCLNFKEGVLDLCCTNAHILSLATIGIKESSINRKIVIPLSVAKNLEALSDDNTTVEISENHILISNKDTTIMARLIDGNFPPYLAVFPEHSQSIEVNTQEFISALNRVALFGDNNTSTAVLNINQDNISLGSENSGTGTSANESISAAVDGNETRIGFNSKLMNVLTKYIMNETIKIQYGSPSKSIIITGGTSDGTHLIMPIIL